jgi:hypothetical protein
LWVIIALLDPDPNSESGSGSTDPIESGSNPDLDPQPCLFDQKIFDFFSFNFIIIFLLTTGWVVSCWSTRART